MTLIQATVHKLLWPQDFWVAIYENGRLWLTLQLIRYGWTSPGILCTQFVQINYILSRPVVTADMAGQLQAICTQFGRDVRIYFRPCRDGRTWSDKHTRFVYIHSGLVWTLFRPRHVVTTTSCRTYVVPQLFRPFRMARIKSVIILCRIKCVKKIIC